MLAVIPLQQMGCAQHWGASSRSAGDRNGGHQLLPTALGDTINNTTEPRAGKAASPVSPSQPRREAERAGTLCQLHTGPYTPGCRVQALSGCTVSEITLMVNIFEARHSSAQGLPLSDAALKHALCSRRGVAGTQIRQESQ